MCSDSPRCDTVIEGTKYCTTRWMKVTLIAYIPLRANVCREEFSPGKSTGRANESPGHLARVFALATYVG